MREATGLRSDVAIRIAGLDEVTVSGDTVALQQLLLNLIGNALRLSPPAPRRDDHAQSTTRAALSVSDQGPGIEPQQLERIFERFYTHRNNGAERGGSGLGLAIARAIATDHNGQLTAENRAAGGATFTLIIPILNHPDDGPSVATPNHERRAH